MVKVRKKAKIRNQYNQVPHLTHDTEWESDKNTIKHHIQDSEEVSHFPTGDLTAVETDITFLVFLSLSHVCPWSGVELDCIDS